MVYRKGYISIHRYPLWMQSFIALCWILSGINKTVNTATTFIQHSSAFITCTTIINKVSVGYCYNIVFVCIWKYFKFIQKISLYYY